MWISFQHWWPIVLGFTSELHEIKVLFEVFHNDFISRRFHFLYNLCFKKNQIIISINIESYWYDQIKSFDFKRCKCCVLRWNKKKKKVSAQNTDIFNQMELIICANIRISFDSIIDAYRNREWKWARIKYDLIIFKTERTMHRIDCVVQPWPIV